MPPPQTHLQLPTLHLNKDGHPNPLGEEPLISFGAVGLPCASALGQSCV